MQSAAAAQAVSSDPRSISDRLKALGFGHRKGFRDGYREVFNLATGDIVGDLTAHEACGFLHIAQAGQ